MKKKLKLYSINVFRVRTVSLYAASKAAAIKEAESRIRSEGLCDEWVCTKSVVEEKS
jgi:hypothetical protein